jgi:hypothetical protein
MPLVSQAVQTFWNASNEVWLSGRHNDWKAVMATGKGTTEPFSVPNVIGEFVIGRASASESGIA